VVRTGHWALAISIALAWLTRTGAGVWHEWIGYLALALVTLRVVWGFLGPRYARFGQFVRSPAETLRYSKQVLKGSAARYLGHNPLGGWMTIALLVTIALDGLSGWLYTTDKYWGVEWVANTHEAISIFLLVLVALHVTGVVVTSLKQRENLAYAMLDGRKRPPGGNDIV
jgi:cytochrome b